jgi:CheY-like chemotaxis protein
MVSIPQQPIWVEADPVRLTQVLINLLNNAVKYTEPGGRIELTAQCEHGEVVARVRDNGIGIPPTMLGQVFDLFSQVDRHLNRAQGGLGIGLAVVQKLVELHGGRVTAHSEGDHHGSEFAIYLPILEDVKDVPRATSLAASATVGLKQRILVVDDNCDVADSHALLLASVGAEVKAVYGGQEALEALAEFQPDVVLLDLGMPGIDGFETAVQLRRRPEGQSLRLIALSGWGQEEDRKRTKDMGFDEHLVKPVDVATLMRVVAGLPANPTD